MSGTLLRGLEDGMVLVAPGILGSRSGAWHAGTLHPGKGTGAWLPPVARNECDPAHRLLLDSPLSDTPLAHDRTLSDMELDQERYADAAPKPTGSASSSDASPMSGQMMVGVDLPVDDEDHGHGTAWKYCFGGHAWH